MTILTRTRDPGKNTVMAANSEERIVEARYRPFSFVPAPQALQSIRISSWSRLQVAFLAFAARTLAHRAFCLRNSSSSGHRHFAAVLAGDGFSVMDR